MRAGRVDTADVGDHTRALNDPQGHRAASKYAWLGLAVVVMTAFVVPVVLRRPMDDDEGYYAIASHLVAQGKTPYADFWFQQAPLLPYVYGLVDHVLGSSWDVLRGTSASFTVLLGGVLFAHGLRRWRSPALAFLAVTLFITTPLVFEWDPTVKTYALSTLLLFGAYVAADSSSRRGWVAAGVLVGLAIDTRLLLATIVVVFGFYAGRHLAQFAAGVITGLVPLLLFFLAGPTRFVNDAVASQIARSHLTLAANATEKLHSVGGVVAEPHLFLLSFAALGLLLASLYERRRVPLAVAIALTLGVTNVIPTPSYQQYFVTLVPFLVIATVDFVVLLRRWRLSNMSIAAIALLAVVMGALVPIGVVPALTSGVVPRTRLDVAAVRLVSSAIDAHTHIGEEVLAFWPGFLFESHARPVPGVESDFEVRALRDTQLSEERAHEYHMVSADGIVRNIRSHRTRIIVLGEGDFAHHEPWRNIIEQAGYRAIARSPFATLYEYGTTATVGG